MGEYIEREKARVRLLQKRFSDKSLSGYELAFNDGLEAAAEIIIKLPAAACSIKYGHWIEDGSGVVICSECGEEHEWQDYRATYCDCCGAKMDGNGNA